MRLLIPLILIFASCGLIFGYAKVIWSGGPSALNPYGKNIVMLKEKKAEYDKALKSAKEINITKERLLRERDSIAPENLDRLSILVPENADAPRLMTDIQTIATRHGMTLTSVFVNEDTSAKEGEPNESMKGSRIRNDMLKSGFLTVTFSVKGTYSSFVGFLSHVQQNLRLIDVTHASFESTKDGLYEYKVTVKTYWISRTP